MLQTPFFKLLATIALLFGTVAAAVYSATHLALAPQLPYADPARLVLSSSRIPFSPPGENRPSFSFTAWSQQAASFEMMAGFHLQNFYLAVPNGDTERLRGSRVSADFFALLGARPLLGRTFLPEDYSANRRLVLLSDEFWRSHLNAARDATGQELWLNGASYEIVGVMPPGFWFQSRRVQFWVLLPARPNYFVTVLARLKPGISFAAAENEARRLEQAGGGRGLIRLQSLKDTAGARVQAAWRITYGVLALVILIGLFLTVPALRSDNPWRTRLGAGARIWAFFLLKAMAGLVPLAALWLFLAGRVAPADVEVAAPFDSLLLLSWPFFLAACGVVGWAVLDQMSRCPLCLSRLRMPLEMGSWDHLWVDEPATEYICPFGHGKLYVSGPKRLGRGERRWTSYRDFWQSLFVK